MNYLLCLDLETTGLDPNYNEIIQIGAILLDEKMRELGEFDRLVKPSFPMRGINKGYNTYLRSEISVEELRKQEPIESVIEDLQTWLLSKGVNLSKPGEIALLGQNIKFDYSFLEKAYEKCSLFFPFDYHAIDVSSIYTSIFLANEDVLPEKVTLHCITSDFNIENIQAHNALADARATLEVFKLMTAAIKEITSVKKEKDKLRILHKS